jgi:hypothetical protein
MLPLFRFIAQHLRSADEPWHTPWEHDAGAEECERYERGQLDRSVHYLKTELADIVNL